MTRRRDLEQHRESLDEIGEILGSMKTLAYMETRKLSRFLAAEQRVLDSIEEVAADFLSFHPRTLVGPGETSPVYLLIGSERGFCGNFNKAVIERFAAMDDGTDANSPRLLAVGHKLHPLIESGAAPTALIEGASVAEDVPAVLQTVIGELDALRPDVAGLALSGVYHTPDGIRVHSLLPPFEQQQLSAPPYSNPPLLNVPASGFLLELIDHYLFAALNHMLYTSLMIENERRVAHLDSAVRHLDDESRELLRKCRSLRQEEITEEIEVILLSAASLDSNVGGG